MGRHRKKIKLIVGILKDTATITKYSFLITKRSSSRARLLVLNATSHSHPTAPPPEPTVADVLAAGQASRHAAGACVGALMDRLHGTRSVHVALKCLYSIHAVLQKGSFLLKDQLSVYPASGGRNFLNMSRFWDKTDRDTWELSGWARWYASVIEHVLTASRVLGYYFSSKSGKGQKLEAVSGGLMEEFEVLVGLVGLISEAPDTSGSVMRDNGLVYESVRLVSEDYGFAQKEILARVQDLEGRVEGLSYGELGRVLDGLNRLESYHERLTLLFVNRKRNDSFWETVSEVKGLVGEEVKEKEEMKQMVVVGNGSAINWFVGLNRLSEGVSKLEDRFAGGPGGRLLLEWRQEVPLTVSMVR